MKRVFAILHEPASYTLDRNAAVYDPMGIGYCYMHSTSQAKASDDCEEAEGLAALSLPALVKRLRNVLAGNDVIIMNGYTGRTFVLLFLLNLWYGRSIGLDSDTQLRVPSNPIKRLIKSVYLKSVFRNIHIFGLPGGTHTHKDLFRHYGMPESRICLMPMMVNNALFRNSNVEREDKVFKFLYVGRVIALKNLELMIDAFIASFGSSGNVQLRIVGDGDLKEYLSLKYQKAQNVIFVGGRYGEDLIQEYKKASVFVLPSSSEQWGLVVNEAMSAGLPVIVSDQVGAAWDLVQGRETGFIFRYDNARELADKMQLLATDRSLYDRYARAAYELMHKHWNYAFYSECLRNFIDKA